MCQNHGRQQCLKGYVWWWRQSCSEDPNKMETMVMSAVCKKKTTVSSERNQPKKQVTWVVGSRDKGRATQAHGSSCRITVYPEFWTRSYRVQCFFCMVSVLLWSHLCPPIFLSHIPILWNGDVLLCVIVPCEYITLFLPTQFLTSKRLFSVKGDDKLLLPALSVLWRVWAPLGMG